MSIFGAEVVMPLLSIVIANYNYGRFLEDAILSVVLQDGFDECELIVVDGGSTDDSVAIIKKYADKISWWVSEKDKGQSDAFNKGFARANGKYLTWLNADDLLFTGCLKKILMQMRKYPDCEWFTGNFVRFINGTGRICQIGWGPHLYPAILQRKNSPLVIFGPTTFFSKRIFNIEAGMDERLHYTMDTDLWVRFIHRGIRSRRLNFFCWAFRMHTGSKTAEFGVHKVSDSAAAQGIVESRIRRSKVDYRPSRVIWALMIVWRILDGSFVMSLYFRLWVHMGKLRMQ